MKIRAVAASLTLSHGPTSARSRTVLEQRSNTSFCDGYVQRHAKALKAQAGRSDPERTRTVIEERCDVGAGWAIGAPRIVSEYLEFVAVESVQSVLSPKPDEPAIVL
jgi:hypothetical protein